MLRNCGKTNITEEEPDYIEPLSMEDWSDED